MATFSESELAGLYQTTYNSDGSVKSRKKIFLDKSRVETCEEGQNENHCIVSMRNGYIFSVDLDVERFYKMLTKKDEYA